MAGRLWNLSEKQRRLCELLALGNAETLQPYTISAACEEVGIARCTYYSWKTNPEFSEYQNYVSDQAQAANIHKYYSILDDIAEKSENDHARLKAVEIVLKRMGKLRDGGQINVEVTDKDLSSKTADELRTEMEQMKKDILGE